MHKLRSGLAKVSNALFFNFGEQGILVKQDGSQYDIYLIEQNKSFHLKKEGLVVNSKDIRIKSEEKPELYDKILIDTEELLIKTSPSHEGNNIYNVQVK